MGCDIHVTFQKKVGASWIDIEHKYEENRHYQLFGWLANVRNGYGFAGCTTSQPIEPLSEPRGFPKDFEVTTGDEHPMPSWFNNEIDEDNPHSKWMGDHSHSWLSADEILNSKMKTIWKTGIISIEEFNSWDGVSQPKSYCAGISGNSISLAESPVDVEQKHSHVRIFWKMSAGEFNYFIDEVKRLVSIHGEIRMVFGFDS